MERLLSYWINIKITTKNNKRKTFGLLQMKTHTVSVEKMWTLLRILKMCSVIEFYYFNQSIEKTNPIIILKIYKIYIYAHTNILGFLITSQIICNFNK